jgi:hypothetical protein
MKKIYTAAVLSASLLVPIITVSAASAAPAKKVATVAAPVKKAAAKKVATKKTATIKPVAALKSTKKAPATKRIRKTRMKSKL